ncbi:MAG: NAD-dependent epimerase/dehydratase family protein [Puniceicoccaceae bacterium]
MKVLLIGGTGTISMAITRQLLAQDVQVTLLNRGNRNNGLNGPNLRYLHGDIHDEPQMRDLLAEETFDVVADFIAFTPAHLERDFRLFRDRCGQFVFISSASAYQSPPVDYRINEGTPLQNPFWKYSRDKIACEAYLLEQYRDHGFPVTLVRPSHTYDERSIPLGVHGARGSWQVAKRMLEGKPVIIHGDGTSLWTLTHNRDFATGFIGLLGNIHAIGEAVQITSDESLTWNQIYGCIAHALGVELRAVHVSSRFLADCSDYDFEGGLLGDKANSVVFDNSKLKRLVPGFQATTRFDQGIRETVQHILNHAELQVEDPEFDQWCDRVIAAMQQALNGVKTS